MKKDATQVPPPVILVSAPWPLYSRPSVQLGALKAFLKTRNPRQRVLALHLYLKVAEQLGFRTYHALSQRTWPAECVFGALLFPERRKEIKTVFQREIKGEKTLDGIDFDALVSQVERVSEGLITGIDWADYQLAGFSICLCQLTSSLYFIRRIKALFPEMTIVVGGSMFAGAQAHGLMEAFPEVDFFINGEGEIPLSQLAKELNHVDVHEKLPIIPGVVSKRDVHNGTPASLSQLATLQDIPCPDYDDYFDLLKTLKSEKKFFPTLPAEVSRGCWWSSGVGGADRKGCTFCNLNLQWAGYRSKSAHQVASEIDHLTSRHGVLSVNFMDNLLPLKDSQEIFSTLGQLGKDLHLFGEIRATTPRDTLEAMKGAGTREVQIGIEALSTALLRKLNKGSTAIQNLQIMRDCEELGISNVSNLILQFPGSEPDHVKETLRALDFAAPFRPLRAVSFWLGFGSPVWHDQAAFGVKAVFNHPNYRILFPPRVCRAVRFMIQSYRGDRGYQRRLWQPVREEIRAWKKAYEEFHSGPSRCPMLTYRDGRDFLMIRQKSPHKDTITHRLTGKSRALYLFCSRHRSLKRIVGQFPTLSEDKILPFLRMMVDKKVMFEENGRYLSLAVHFSD